PPRLHSREVVLERAAREGLTLLLTSATPSVEMWWQAGSGRADAVLAPPGPWPAVSLADTRGLLRGEQLTPPLVRAIRETLAAGRVARGESQRRAAAAAQVVIGTRGALRLFGRAALGLAGFVSPDQLLRLPDFRAGERTLALLWAAAERVGAGGALVIQSQNPT